MKKMTLLEMTQDILSAMNSDAVNSVSDTVESEQVANEIRNTFYQLFTNSDLPEFKGLITLQSLNSDATPHLLKIPETIANIDWIKYLDYRSATFVDCVYLTPEEYIHRVVLGSRANLTPFVEVALHPESPITYALPAEAHPKYYTSFDDPTILVFDSFDSDNESYLTASNAMCWGTKNLTFIINDEFVPAIDANLFPRLLAEAKSACFINIKEVANSKEEQRARRQAIKAQTRLNRTDDMNEGVFSANDYSRRRGTRQYHRRYDSRGR